MVHRYGLRARRNDVAVTNLSAHSFGVVGLPTEPPVGTGVSGGDDEDGDGEENSGEEDDDNEDDDEAEEEHDNEGAVHVEDGEDQGSIGLHDENRPQIDGDAVEGIDDAGGLDDGGYVELTQKARDDGATSNQRSNRRSRSEDRDEAGGSTKVSPPGHHPGPESSRRSEDIQPHLGKGLNKRSNEFLDSSSGRRGGSKRSKTSSEQDTQGRSSPARNGAQSHSPPISTDTRPSDWKSVHQDMIKNGASDADIAELSSLYDRMAAMANDEERDVPDPPEYNGSPLQYLQELTRFVKGSIMNWCKATFTSAMFKANTAKHIAFLHTEQQNMLEHVETGGWPWREDRKIAPVNINAPPKASPTLGDMSLSLGFGASIATPLSGSWSKVRSLYTGTQNHVGLWQKNDADGDVLDRVVIKEVYFDRNDWYNKEYWEEGSKGDRIPMEAYLQKAVGDLDESFNVVKCLDHVLWKQKMYRIYQEYCPMGDLGECWDYWDWVSPFGKTVADLSSRGRRLDRQPYQR